MSALVAYPPSEPRLVAASADPKPDSMHVAFSSGRARARFRLSQTPWLGGLLWKPPPPAVAHAWEAAAALLQRADQPILGILSDPGPEQRLTLIPADEDVVVKVAVYPDGEPAVARERANLLSLEHTQWRGLGPKVRADPSGAFNQTALVMERVPGRHPSWDDRLVVAELVRALRPTHDEAADPSAGLHHGDTTPWNVVQRNRCELTLLDWEYADLSVGSHCICGVLDYVLRGAVVARARPGRVRPVLASAVRQANADGLEPAKIIGLYREYRDQVRKVSRGRPDRLSNQAEALLLKCLTR